MDIFLRIIPQSLTKEQIDESGSLCKSCVFGSLVDCTKLDGDLDCRTYGNSTVFIIDPENPTLWSDGKSVSI